MLRTSDEGGGPVVTTASRDAAIERMRRELFADGLKSEAEAEALFAFEATGVSRSTAWTDFFVESLTDFLVWQSRPTGTLSDQQAEWLLLQADGVKSINAMALLVNVLAQAHAAPDWFRAAVRQRAAQGWPDIEAAIARAQP